MTRKDFTGIANAITDARKVVLEARATDDAGFALDEVSNAIADFCQTQNPNFDRARFLKACGV